MNKLSLGFCGLNCEKCPIFIATTNNDNELRQKIAEELPKLYAEYNRNNRLNFEDINCNGCRSEYNLFIGCEKCSIRKCCKEKDLIICANCAEYDQCEILNSFLTKEKLKKEL